MTKFEELQLRRGGLMMKSTERWPNYVVKYCQPLYLHSHVDTVWESYKSLSTNWPKKYWWNHLGTALIWIWQMWAKSWHWHWERGWVSTEAKVITPSLVPLTILLQLDVPRTVDNCSKLNFPILWFHPAWHGLFYSWPCWLLQPILLQLDVQDRDHDMLDVRHVSCMISSIS